MQLITMLKILDTVPMFGYFLMDDDKILKKKYLNVHNTCCT